MTIRFSHRPDAHPSVGPVVFHNEREQAKMPIRRRSRTRKGSRLTFVVPDEAQIRPCNFCGRKDVPDGLSHRWWGLSKKLPVAFSCPECTPRVKAKIETLSNTRQLSIVHGWYAPTQE